MNKVFYWCVDFLKAWSSRWHMTYEELNVWLFVILEPLLILVMLIIIVSQHKKIRRLRE